MKLSVIMPVYKAERYLNDSVNSIVTQSFKNWELIMVDDGSPDKSGALCDDWAKRDSRIRVFHHENRGVSAARNFALDQAKGDYAILIDSDDWVQPGLFAAIDDRVKKTGADVILLMVKRVFKKEKDKYPLICLDEKMTPAELMKISLCGFVKEPYARICSRRIFERIRFNESLKSAEDLYALPDILKECTSLSFINNKYYFYNKTNGSSLTHKVKGGQSLIYEFKAWKHFFDCCIKCGWDKVDSRLSYYYLAQCLNKAVQLIHDSKSIADEKIIAEAERFVRTYRPEFGIKSNNDILIYEQYYYNYEAARLAWFICGGINGVYKDRILRAMCRFACIQSVMPESDKDGIIWRNIHNLAISVTAHKGEYTLSAGQRITLKALLMNWTFWLRWRGKRILEKNRH